MHAAVQNFFLSEGGAVTVDWVVLTAAIVALGLAVMAVVAPGYNDVTNAIADDMATQSLTVGDHPFGRTQATPPPP